MELSSIKTLTIQIDNLHPYMCNYDCLYANSDNDTCSLYQDLSDFGDLYQSIPTRHPDCNKDFGTGDK